MAIVKYVGKDRLGRHRVRLRVRNRGRIINETVYGRSEVEALRAAKARAKELEAKKVLGSLLNVTKARQSFESYASHFEEMRFRARGLSDNARLRDASLLKNHVLPVFGDRYLREIHRSHVQDWVSGMIDAGLSQDTIRRCYQALARIMDDALENRFIEQNPCRKIEIAGGQKRRTKQPLTPEQVVALSEALPRRYWIYPFLGAETGLRPGELAALKVGDFDFLRRTLTVSRGTVEPGGRLGFKSPKTEASEGTVTLSPWLVEMLAAFLAEFPPGPDGLIFVGPKGGALRPNNFRKRVWEKAVAAAGLPAVTPGALRHTQSTWMGTTFRTHPKTMQARMRHQDPNLALKIYTHYEQGQDAEVARAMDALWRATAAKPRSERARLS
ncbi:MAG: tyrosine-type recombinase/integrase [Actinomycetota bacterium]